MSTAYVKAEVRRRQLIDAAHEVMRENGVAGTTLRAIAARAEVPLGTVHYIFPSKEQLLRAVLEDVVAQIAATSRAAQAARTDLAEALKEGARAFWRELVEPDPREQLMQYELLMWALRQDSMAGLARWMYEQYLGLLSDLWTEASARAGVTLAAPPDELASMLLAGVDGLILQYLALRDADRARSDLDVLVHRIVRHALAR